MVNYRHFSFEERCSIARLREAGQSIRHIAAALDRSPSSISRELKRNSGSQIGYAPVHADERAWARRWTGSRLERDDALREAVLGRLAAGWSPEQITGRLALEHGRPIISHESIYRFVYAQMKRTQNFAWRLYLPRAKTRRGWRGRRGGSPVHHFKARRPLAERPVDAADRIVPGHWEGDTILFTDRGQMILAAHERSSRLTILARQPGKAAAPVAAQLARWLEPLPPSLRRSIAFDNGTEFAEHHKLNAFGLETFFCDVRSPWQKGGVENAIGRLRRYLPRKTNLDELPDTLVEHAARAYNNTPRKCLGFRTPAEAFHMLHFKCESTS